MKLHQFEWPYLGLQIGLSLCNWEQVEYFNLYYIVDMIIGLSTVLSKSLKEIQNGQLILKE